MKYTLNIWLTTEKTGLSRQLEVNSVTIQNNPKINSFYHIKLRTQLHQFSLPPYLKLMHVLAKSTFFTINRWFSPTFRPKTCTDWLILKQRTHYMRLDANRHRHKRKISKFSLRFSYLFCSERRVEARGRSVVRMHSMRHALWKRG